MFAEIIICMNKRKSAACSALMAIPLLTRNFFRSDIIKIRGNIAYIMFYLLTYADTYQGWFSQQYLAPHSDFLLICIT
jgi:hypothetical protein